MNITLTGATGFLGRRIVTRLLDEGNRLHVIGRGSRGALPPEVAFSSWENSASSPPAPALRNAQALIHLAGEPVSQRWTPAVKQRIRSSRVDSTVHLAEALASLPTKPEFFLCASAIGIYGSRGEESLTESSTPGSGFLAEVCVDWERAADSVEALGIRTVKLRTGIVLGSGGGALAQMAPLFRAGLGGKLGSGRQWMSWIHIDDIAALVSFALNNPAASGPVNACAPHPVRNAEFTRSLAHALHRPALFTVPRFALALGFGEMASVVLASQRVLPAAASSLGYPFLFPSLDPALTSLSS